MEYDNTSDEDFEDDEDTTVSKGYVYKASYVIVAIDTHPLMFKPNTNGRIPFRDSLESCLRILESLIFVKDFKRWNPFAIILAKDDHILISFEDNIVESVAILKSKLKLSDDELEDQYQRKGDLDLAEFFLQCKKAFYDIKAVFYKRILIYITNDENPVENAQSKSAVINQVKSFDASGMSLEIIPTVADFDFTLVYNEMLALLDRDPYQVSQEEVCIDVEGLEQKLSSVLLPKQYKTTVNLYTNKNELNKYVMTCVDIKLTKSKNLLNVKVSAEGKSVKRKPRPARDEPPTYTIKSRKKHPLGVAFEAYEKDQMYDITFPRGYTLMYISKPNLKPMYSVSQPHLLQEHANDKSGYFKKFWQYCVDNDRVLVCVVKHKQPSKIKFCEFSPLVVGKIPSFLCKRIPYGNHIKLGYDCLKPTPNVQVHDEKMNLVRQLVNKLTIEFDPSMIPNQKYRKKLQYVKSKLLGEQFVDDFKLFNRSTLDSRISEEVEKITAEFGLQFFPDPGKRKRPSTQTGGSRKKKN